MPTKFETCPGCGAERIIRLAVALGNAKMICGACGHAFQQILYHRKAVGRVDGWQRFGVEPTRFGIGKFGKEIGMARKWHCEEHGFTAKTGPGWGAHKRHQHGGKDPNARPVTPKALKRIPEALAASNIGKAIEELNVRLADLVKESNEINRAIAALENLRPTARS